MKNVIALAIIATAMMATTAAAQVPPDDAAKYHLVTVTVDPPSPAGAALLASLDRHPALAGIAQQCKRFDFNVGDDIYKARYAAALPPVRLPIVALVRSDGGVLFKASGPAIPQADELASQLTEISKADRLANPRRIPQTAPQQIADCPTCPQPAAPRRPLLPFDGSRIPDMIPDTLTLQPQVNIPDSAGIAAVVGLLIVIAIAGLICGAILLWPSN